MWGNSRNWKGHCSGVMLLLLERGCYVNKKRETDVFNIIDKTSRLLLRAKAIEQVIGGQTE